MERPFEPGTSWLGFYGRHESVPIRELYAVFGRPRTAADRRDEPLAATSWSGIDWGAEIAMDEGRVLLAGLGGAQDLIYAAPLGEDRLVVAVLPNGGGGSGRPGPDGLRLGWNQTETGALVVFGLVADTIESVDLVVAGVTLEARMGENAFGLRLERTHADDLERVVLRRLDGTENTVELQPKD